MKLLSIAGAVLLGNLVAAASIELTPENIAEELQSGTWLIEHFSPYCPHCKNFAPEWKKLSDDLDYLAEDADFRFGTIDCSTQGDLCDEHDIEYYPTIQLWENGEKADTWTGVNKYDPLTEYILKQVNSEQQTPEEEEEEEQETEADNTEEDDEEEEEEEEGEEGETDAEGEQVELDGEQPSEEEQTQEEEEGMGPEVFEDITEDEEELSAAVITTTPDKNTPNPSGVSLNLEGKQMEEIASGRIPWFIKFYAPWCPHCQRLAPTWKDMASDLRNQVNVGEVNCEALPAVCQEFDIRGYPTLQMYGHGSPIRYTGDRTLQSLLKFAHAHAGPHVREIDSNELDQELSSNDVVLLYLHQQIEIPESISSLADENIAFYSTQDPEILKRFDLSSSDLPALLISKDNTHHIYPSHDLSNREDIIAWIESERNPRVISLDPSNYEAILSGEDNVVLNIVNAKDTASQAKFRNIATEWQDTLWGDGYEVVFAEMDRAVWRDYVREKFDIQDDDTPKLVIYQPSTGKHFTKELNNVYDLSLDRWSSMFALLKDIQEMKPYKVASGYRSEPRLSWVLCIFLVAGVVYKCAFRPKTNTNVLPTYTTYSHKD